MHLGQSHYKSGFGKAMKNVIIIFNFLMRYYNSKNVFGITCEGISKIERTLNS